MEALCIIKAGMLAGIIMSAVAMMLNMLKITSLDITKYVGCMMTGQSSGMTSMIAGLAVHSFMSVLFAFVYAWVADQLNMAMSLQTGLILGFAHGVVGGMMTPVVDSMNGCIKAGKVKAMKMFASGYGTSAIATYFVIHVAYGVALAQMLSM